MASLWKLLAACVIRNTITTGASVTRASPRSSCSGGILGESPGVGFACCDWLFDFLSVLSGKLGQVLLAF